MDPRILQIFGQPLPPDPFLPGAVADMPAEGDLAEQPVIPAPPPMPAPPPALAGPQGSVPGVHPDVQAYLAARLDPQRPAREAGNLRAAQFLDQVGNTGSDLGRNFTRAAELIRGEAPSGAGGGPPVNPAVRDYLLNRQVREGEEGALAGRMAQAKQLGDMAAMEDPASHRSKEMQAAIAAVYPRLGPAVAGMSAAAIGRSFPAVKELFDKQAEADLEGAKERNAGALETTKQGGENARAEAERKNRLDLERMRQAGEDRRAGMKAKENDPNVTADFTATGPNKLSNEERNDFAKTEAAARTLQAKVKAYRDAFIGKSGDVNNPEGTELFGGARKSDLNSKYRDLELAVKSAAQLGVLSNSDLKLLDDMVPKATGIAGALTRDSSIISSLDALDESARSGLGAKAKTLGLSERGGAPPAPTGERKTLRGKTYEKRADGWHEVA